MATQPRRRPPVPVAGKCRNGHEMTAEAPPGHATLRIKCQAPGCGLETLLRRVKTTDRAAGDSYSGAPIGGIQKVKVRYERPDREPHLGPEPDDHGGLEVWAIEEPPEAAPPAPGGGLGGGGGPAPTGADVGPPVDGDRVDVAEPRRRRSRRERPGPSGSRRDVIPGIY